MKKNLIKTGLLACLLCFGLASCDNAQKQEKQVEAFVGAYNYQTTGEADIFVGGMKITTIPLNYDGSFRIVRSGADNRVAIVSYNDSIFGTVNGKELTIETTSMNLNYEDFDMKLSFLNNKAQLVSDTVLQWQSDIMVMATYNALSASGNGSINLVAEKEK